MELDNSKAYLSDGLLATYCIKLESIHADTSNLEKNCFIKKNIMGGGALPISWYTQAYHTGMTNQIYQWSAILFNLGR